MESTHTQKSTPSPLSGQNALGFSWETVFFFSACCSLEGLFDQTEDTPSSSLRIQFHVDAPRSHQISCNWSRYTPFQPLITANDTSFLCNTPLFVCCCVLVTMIPPAVYLTIYMWSIDVMKFFVNFCS